MLAPSLLHSSDSMPGRVRVKILSARNLPVMDRASFSTDAFVELKLGNCTYKSEVVRKSLNPQWNTEWFKFELDDEELQDEALQIRVLDHDTYSSHDSIGKVYIDLNPLLARDGSASMSGWFPLYDTMHGIRGDIQLTVRLDLFSDLNQYRESSLGVQFFYNPGLPQGTSLQQLLGFVEELVVNDDPEYQWLEKIRTSRASNEARQRLFSRLNGQLQRKLGLRVLGMGGNAVVGYRLHFDLEGESGIVVRGIGTAVCLGRAADGSASPTKCSSSHSFSAKSDAADTEEAAASDDAASGLLRPAAAKHPPPSVASLDAMPENPFVTMSSLPAGLVSTIGGTVAAKSVKLLDRIHNPETPETRDAWWSELRAEMRSHARAFGCSAVIGYREETCIADDLIVLTAYGTAARLGGVAEEPAPASCRVLHAAYGQSAAPLPVSLFRCGQCGRGSVPDILLSTADCPPELARVGRPALVQAQVWRPKKECKGEANAKEVSDRLPFMEYELHSQLVRRLRLRGMNSLFCLRMRLSVAAGGLLLSATGTGLHLPALPEPSEPAIVAKGDSKQALAGLQTKVAEFAARSREVYQLQRRCAAPEPAPPASAPSLSEGLELQDPQRDTFVIELADECEAEELEALLADYPLLQNLQLTASPSCVAADTNFFVRVFRCPLDEPEATSSRQVNGLVSELLHSTGFHFRHCLPCSLTALHFHTEVTDEACLQIVLTGDCQRQEAPPDGQLSGTAASVLVCSSAEPPGCVRKHVGNLDFFFVRETSSVRECGGSQAFLQTCLAEVLAVVRAHAAALGGQAVTSFHLSDVLLLDNAGRGQAQCLLNVCGDVLQLAES